MIDAKINSLFVINSYAGKLSNIDNNKLELEILASQERLNNNPNHTMFEDMVLKDEPNTQAELLLNTMESIGKEIGCTMDGFWHHIHHKYESSEYHHHFSPEKDIDLSWVYYVKAKQNCGDLVFKLDLKDDRIPDSAITPKEGHFIIFPSFLLHKVSKNMSDDLRISVAGNYIPYGKRGANNNG